MSQYDSKKDTLAHINRVRELLREVIQQLEYRAEEHDKSKLEAPEKQLFDEYTPKLKSVTYGSDKYKDYLKNLQPALEHHYKNNSHHPEYWENGVLDMDLLDLIEMVVDWKAATERHENGDIKKSLEINKNRFKIPEALMRVIENTIYSLGYIKEED